MGFGVGSGGSKVCAEESECYSSGSGEPLEIFASLCLKFLFCKSFRSLQTEMEPVKRLLK